MAGTTGGVVMRGCSAVPSHPVGPTGPFGRQVVPAPGAQGSAGEASQSLSVHGGGATVMAKGWVGSGWSTRVMGPHGEGDGMLGQGMAVGAAVGLVVQEALGLVRTLL